MGLREQVSHSLWIFSRKLSSIPFVKMKWEVPSLLNCYSLLFLPPLSQGQPHFSNCQGSWATRGSLEAAASLMSPCGKETDQPDQQIGGCCALRSWVTPGSWDYCFNPARPVFPQMPGLTVRTEGGMGMAQHHMLPGLGMSGYTDTRAGAQHHSWVSFSREDKRKSNFS